MHFDLAFFCLIVNGTIAWKEKEKSFFLLLFAGFSVFLQRIKR